MALKKGDFVNIDYIGRVEGRIFDLTDEKLAKKENVYNEKTKYGPITIVIGAGHLIKGIDEALIGKKVGDEFKIEVEPEKAFGKKNPKLLKIIPERLFKNQKVKPYPGMTVNVDNLVGYVVSVGAGRVIVDFNHPLAGKILEYEIKIHKKIEDDKEKVKAILELYTNKSDYKIELKDKQVKIYYPKEKPVPQNAQKVIIDDIKKYIKLEKVEFVEQTKQNKEKR